MRAVVLLQNVGNTLNKRYVVMDALLGLFLKRIIVTLLQYLENLCYIMSFYLQL